MELGSPKAVPAKSQCWPHAGYAVPVCLPLSMSPIRSSQNLECEWTAMLVGCLVPGSAPPTGPQPKPSYWLGAMVPPRTTPVITSADPQLCSASRPPILPLFPPLSLTKHHHPLFLYSLIPLGSATSNFPMARALGGTPSANCHGRKAVCLSPGGREF